MVVKLFLLFIGVLQIFGKNLPNNEYDLNRTQTPHQHGCKIIFIGVLQIFGKNLSNNEYDNLLGVNDSVLIKKLFSKMNEILVTNDEISKDLLAIKEREDLQEKVMNQLNENLASINRTINEISADNKLLKLYSGWSVIQRRQDDSEDFYRSWEDYKQGFGNPYGEFFIGLEKLHQMTLNGERQELLIILKDFNQQSRYAKYDHLVIGNETEKYILKELGKYSGDAGDALSWHKGYKFSTKDQANEDYDDVNCAEKFKGAWWFGKCSSIYFSFYSHLNGPYLQGAGSDEGGINWYHWHGLEYSLKYFEIMLRTLY